MDDKILRYIRQIALPEIGIIGQKKLMSSRAVIVGAGALASPAALYLASAGIGAIGIVDDDVVNLDNLHRQILHKTASIGKLKVESARATILELNPDVVVETRQERLNESNAESILQNYDVVLDGTDNFQARYLINSICVKRGMPFVMGSILRFEGQVSVFNACHPRESGDPLRALDSRWSLPPNGLIGGGNDSPCYSCLYPEPPPVQVSPTCARAGVLGVIPGIIGTMQALETIKLICGFGEPLIGKLLIFDGLTCKMRILEVKKDIECKVCSAVSS